MCVSPATGLVWSMNCESWLEPKNSLMEATIGRMLMSDCGVISSTSWVRHALAHDALHAGKTDPELVLDQLADADRMRRLPKWSMSSMW